MVAECSLASRVRSRSEPASPPLTRAARSAVGGNYQRDGEEWLAPAYEVAKTLHLKPKTRSTAHRKGPAMDHIAIDLGGKKSQICARNADGTIVEEMRWATAQLETYFKQRPPSRVIVETSAEAFRIADIARQRGHDARVVASTLVPALGVGAGGVKTDRRDARILSEVSTRIDLPSVHIPSDLSRTWKSICTSREALVTARTQLINSVRGWLRSRISSVRSGAVGTFTKRVRTLLKNKVPSHIEPLLCVIDDLNKHIARADYELKQLAKTDPVCSRLTTIPGVGPVTAIRFVAALDDIKRFRDAHAVQCYLGLVPGEDSSSKRKRRTGITKAGPPRVRWALGQAAWILRRTRPLDPLVQWAFGVEHRRGKKVAIVALARRLAGVMYALWRDGTRYEPSRLRTPARNAAA